MATSRSIDRRRACFDVLWFLRSIVPTADAIAATVLGCVKRLVRLVDELIEAGRSEARDRDPQTRGDREVGKLRLANSTSVSLGGLIRLINLQMRQ